MTDKSDFQTKMQNIQNALQTAWNWNDQEAQRVKDAINQGLKYVPQWKSYEDFLSQITRRKKLLA